MANVTFDLLWRECMRELLDLLELEQPPEDFGSWKEDQVISHFSYLYIRYVLLYTSLEDCMDQHVHAQKRKDIQAAVESVMGRLLEVKALLMSASGSAFVNFDDILVDLKLTPSVLDIIAPRYCVDPSMIAQRNQMWQSFHSQIPVDEEAEREKSEKEKMPLDECIRVLQRNERGRQGRQRAMFMAEISKQEAKSAAKATTASARAEIDADQAAVFFQKLWKGFKTKKEANKMRDEELILIGMKEAPQRSAEDDPVARQAKALKLQQVREYRRMLVKEHEELYEAAISDTNKSMYEQEGQLMKEKMCQVIEDWGRNVLLATGEVPDLPDEEEGGSLDILKPVAPAVDAGEGGGAAGDAKGKGKGDDKKKDKKKEKGGEEGGEEGVSSAFIPNIRSNVVRYCDFWEFKNEDDNFAQHADVTMIQDMLRPSVEELVRVKDVDVQMREYLANLRVAVEAGQKGKKKKAKKKPKKKKEKKGKKKKDPTEGRSMESIYGELVVAGILKPIPTSRLVDFQGSFKNADPSTAGPPGDEQKALTDPSLAAVRQLLMEQVVLPLSSENVAASAPYPQTLLLYGPQQGGKSMLIDALAAECGANVFELGCRNTDGKYEKKKAAMMMHMVFKLAKALAPSIIKFDEAELTWLSDKKKVKAMGFSEPGARILKDMTKEMKDLAPSDRVVLIGESKQPWLCEKGDQKKFLSFFKLLVYVPICDYGSLQYTWRHHMQRAGIASPADLKHVDISTLAHLCYVGGYPAGAVAAACAAVCSERRVARMASKPFTTSAFTLALSKQEPVYTGVMQQFKDWMKKIQGEVGKPKKEKKGKGDKKKK